MKEIFITGHGGHMCEAWCDNDYDVGSNIDEAIGRLISKDPEKYKFNMDYVSEEWCPKTSVKAIGHLISLNPEKFGFEIKIDNEFTTSAYDRSWQTTKENIMNEEEEFYTVPVEPTAEYVDCKCTYCENQKDVFSEYDKAFKAIPCCTEDEYDDGIKKTSSFEFPWDVKSESKIGSCEKADPFVGMGTDGECSARTRTIIAVYVGIPVNAEGVASTSAEDYIDCTKMYLKDLESSIGTYEKIVYIPRHGGVTSIEVINL